MTGTTSLPAKPMFAGCANAYLLAEDDPADAELVQEMLRQTFGAQCVIDCVDRFERIQRALERDTFKALILDLNLPDRSGIDNVSELSRKYPQLPIVVLTGDDNLDLAIHSLQKGAQDYLSKNQVTPDLLSRSLRYAEERKRIEGELKHALKDTALRNSQLESMARHDFLTSLPNRAYFQSSAVKTLMRAARVKKYVGLLYFDLNGFKKINDSYGHVAGDELLRKVAARFKNTVRESEFLARMGGDEFVIITDVLEHKKNVYKLVNRLIEDIEPPFTVGSHQIFCSLSIGVSYYPDADTLDLLIKQADCAMYEAKNKRHAHVCFYTPQVESYYSRNIDIESRFSEALSKMQFHTYFQALHSVAHPEQTHAEALLRWYSPTLGNVSPNEFIPLAENSPIINNLTQAVITQCRNLYQAMEELNQPDARISINVCASQLSSNAFCNQLLAWLDEFGLSPAQMCLELTERQMVKNAKQCGEYIGRLRARGLKIALDDFGTGYSSITHLLELPLDYLKLDRVLIDHIDQNPRNQALTAGIVEMANRLDMEVVAEGIEREEEFQAALELGCDYLQGYYIAQPLPMEELLCHTLRH